MCSKGNYFQGQYQVDDGYVGASRPQHFPVFMDDIEDDMTDDQLESLYEDLAYEHFLQNVSCITSRLGEFKVWAKKVMAERSEDEGN